MEISHLGMEEDLADGREDRIADVMVLPGHGSGLDAALKAVAHDQVVPLAQFGNEAVEAFEVVAHVRVGHDAVASARGGDCAVERRAVAANGDGDDARAHAGRNLLRTIGRAVIADDDFAAHAGTAKVRLRFPDTTRQRLCLVEAGHDYAEFHGHLSLPVFA